MLEFLIKPYCNVSKILKKTHIDSLKSFISKVSILYYQFFVGSGGSTPVMDEPEYHEGESQEVC